MNNIVIAVIFAALYLGTTAFLCRGFRFNTQALSLGAISIAVTLVLAGIAIPLPTGASISPGSWVPLMLLALTYDPRLAMLAGVACGALTPFLLPGWSLVHWVQFFLEYMTLFSCMGYAGIFGRSKKSRMLLGIWIAILLRISAQVISGAVFFGEYAWQGWGAWGYSLIFHLTAKIPEGLLTTLILMKMPLDRIAGLLKGK